jgi:hypothetical protein
VQESFNYTQSKKIVPVQNVRVCAALKFCQTRRTKWKTVLIIVVAGQVDAQGKRESLQAAAWKTVSQEAFM